MKAKISEGRSQAQEPVPLPLKDGEWAHIEKHLTRHSSGGGRPTSNRRQHLEGMRWVAWTGKPWIDMPKEFGNAKTVYKYYSRLRANGVLMTLLTAFPSTSYKESLNTVRAQLECLHKLEDRRPRGTAALNMAALKEGGLSPIGDKPRAFLEFWSPPDRL
ncbi:transposase [Sphingomonas sp. PB4P5]|uniref:transposase n=1 Tax=Parasphingomonas puruogangriensis TaxID=3096155 RepID=UPI002FCBA158